MYSYYKLVIYYLMGNTHIHLAACDAMNTITIFYVLSARDVLSTHPLLRPKVMWEGI